MLFENQQGLKTLQEIYIKKPSGFKLEGFYY